MEKEKQSKKLQFGETVKGYYIPVLNEREIRAAAGILFLGVLISFMLIVFKEDFLLLKFFITIFLIDFIIRVFISPKYSPTLIIGRLIVSRQNPEYVGAPQKKVAWIIGVILASIMFVLMVLLNTYSFISGIICLICLIFLFFESAFGICLGCMVYGWINKDKAQYCPGEICDIKARQDIQKTSWLQIGILLLFIAVIVLIVFLFKADLNTTPEDLFQKFK